MDAPNDRKASLPKASATALMAELESCMLLDAFRLQKRLRALPRRRRGTKRELQQIEAQLRRSQQRRAKRLESLPTLAYPDALPVTERREELHEAVAAHPVVIVAGETGSGKTTQLPKICLELGRGVGGMIGVTQPRRIAAMSVAERVAHELDTAVGHAVGYQIRFDARVRPETYIKFMTDGVLLAETAHDRGLRAYDTIIIDEAHERTLNIDFLLGYVYRLLRQRDDLKVIISSATLDVERFQRFFDRAPVVAVEGRAFPVATRYRPAADEEADLAGTVAAALDEILSESDTGDTLVFLATEQEIRELDDVLGSRLPGNIELLPLFGRLPAAEQRRVFQPGEGRRVILSTNVAETSVTVPGIRYVVDAGQARIRRYNHRTQVERLQIERVSRASAAQRQGRCGRLGPGICIRLYTQEDYNERDRFTDPEIKRTSLARVILQMKALRLGAAESFPFMDRPQASAIRRGYDELIELRALDRNRDLTDMGRAMARLPVEPRYARMLLAAADRGALAEALITVAALDVQDPRERPFDKRDAADTAHRRFLDHDSDFLSWLHLWRFLHEQRACLPSNNQFRRFCRENFLAYRRVREWMRVRDQLADAMAALGAQLNQEPASYVDLHQALLAGLLSRLGMLTEERDYRGAHGVRFAVWPGSGLFKKRPAWVMAAELVETKRLYGRCVARIAPEWAETVAGDLCTRTYLEPHWDGRAGLARAFERVSLFGLPVVNRRRVHYGPIYPDAARKLMIHDGLIRGDLRTRLDFFHHNQTLVRKIESLEHKGRRRDLLVDRAFLYTYYDERIPADIYTARRLERWWHRVSRRDARFLYMKREEVQLFSPDGITPDRFPPEFHVGDLRLPLSYRFAPGEEDDGVTCAVPVGVLPQLDGWRFAWLVPGLLGEKVALLLRSLPRTLRRPLVPIPDTVERVLPQLQPGDEPLATALAKVLRELTGVRVSPSQVREEDLPAFLRMRFVVVDEKRQVLAAGRDLDELREQFRQQTGETFVRAKKSGWEREGITSWDLAELPEQVELHTAAGAFCFGFPALQDQGESVAICVLDTPEAAAHTHHGGVRRLLSLCLASQCKNIKKSLPISQAADLAYAAMGGASLDLRADLVLNALDHVFLEGQPSIRTAAAFEQRQEENKGAFYAAAQRLGPAVDSILCQTQALRVALEGFSKPVYAESVSDLREQLERLVHPGFLRLTPYGQIEHIPRYLQAATLRLERLRRSPSKDRQRLQQLRPFWERLLEAEHRGSARLHAHPAYIRFRWLMEEFRVSLFAQEIGTAETASAKRLREQWALVEKEMKVE